MSTFKNKDNFDHSNTDLNDIETHSVSSCSLGVNKKQERGTCNIEFFEFYNWQYIALSFLPS
jgi:hypothetical protein